MSLLVCHIGWMSWYEGLNGKPDKIVGEYVQTHGRGAEVCNFLRCKDNNVYGHVETNKRKKDRPINIELLGATEGAKFADGVDVVWTATNPDEGGRRVVGWYRNAQVFRKRQAFLKTPSSQHKRDRLKTFHVRTGGDVTLLPLERRTLLLGRGKGWIGQANWWFPAQSKNPAVKKFIDQVYRLMDKRQPAKSESQKNKTRGRWGGGSDPERKAAVELAALAVVQAHYSGCKIKSVEDENLGWDLEVSGAPSGDLRLEVKGLSGMGLQVGLTPREYLALSAHMGGSMDNYRLCVVTGSLDEKPRLVIFRYSREASRWTDECSRKAVSPTIKRIEAAIISLA
jgi:hypothetical protein